MPVSAVNSLKNFWLKIKATPEISSTLASASECLFIKFAVIAIANFPLNSFLLNPKNNRMQINMYLPTLDVIIQGNT